MSEKKINVDFKDGKLSKNSKKIHKKRISLTET